MYCSSSPVPSVATTSACVSPRVNSAEPWARGRMPTSETIGRTVFSRGRRCGCLVEDVPAHDLGLDFLEGRLTFWARSSVSSPVGRARP